MVPAYRQGLVAEEPGLGSALEKVVRNGGSAGVDQQSVRWVQKRKEEVIAGLERELREGRYRPLPVRRVWIEKLGSKEKRPLVKDACTTMERESAGTLE